MAEKNILVKESDAVVPHILSGVTPFVGLEAGASIKSLEDLMPAPVRIREEMSFIEMQSFFQYVEKFKTGKTIFIQHDANKLFEAIFDYHESAKNPAWGDHLAKLVLRHDKHFIEWNNIDARWMSQVEFAEFIELNALTISKPDAATILEVAKSLQAKRKVNFLSGITTTNGDVQFKYEETTEAKAGERQNVDVPGEFTIKVPIFYNQEKKEVKIRLFWRINDSKALTFRCQMLQKQDLIDDAVESVRVAIENAVSAKILICE